MNLDPFFLFVGVCASFVATTAIGVSTAIIARRIRNGGEHPLPYVLALALSWNIFACMFTFRFWSGAYDPSRVQDRIVVSFVMLAFTAGGIGLYFLWADPRAKGKR